MHLEANNTSRRASSAPTVTTSSTSPQEASNQASKTVNKSKENFTAAAQSQNEEKEEEVFLPTAIVSVDNNGKRTDIRAILDSGSQNNACSTTPWIEKRKSRRPSFWARSSRSQQPQKIINLILKTKDEDFIRIRATVLAKLTSNLPSRHVNVSSWTKLQDLNLADPSFKQLSTIDLIIGAGHYKEITIGDNRMKKP